MLSPAIFGWLAYPLSEVLVDASIKASVLLALTAVATLMLRRVSAAVRHRLWCLGFYGVVLMPVLSMTLPQWRLPLLPATKVSETPRVIVQANAQTPLDDHQIDARPGDARVTHGGPLGATPGRPELNNAPISGSDETETIVDDPRLLTSTQHRLAHVPVRPNFSINRGWFIGLWLAGLALVLLPFTLGLAGNAWMLGRSRHVHAQAWTRMLDELAAKLELSRRVALWESSESVVPMTWGVIRPIVLLPSESGRWSDERRRFVLLHELAHVKRFDVLFQSIARLACAFYWFNPLAWYALWQLRIERELACDDCVVAAGERPSDYASQLLEIARAYRPARFSVGVAMASTTKLETRIVAMLDRARPHLPVGKHLARTLAAGACLVVIGLSVIGLGERSVTSADEQKNGANDDSKPPLARPHVANTKLARGVVVDEAGQPIANAKVFTVLSSRERYTWTKQHQVVARTTSDQRGHFEINVPPFKEMTLGNEHRITHSMSLLATASQFGPDAFELVNQARPNRQITLKLVKDTVPIEGRVLDLEGRPIAGARLQVRSIQTTTSDLETWIARARNNPRSIPNDFRVAAKVRQKVVYFPTEQGIDVEGLAMFPPVTTDADGRFRFTGLGPNRLVKLEIEGPSIAKEWINAITRAMPTVPFPTSDPRSRGERCFGATFDYTAEPTQVVRGTVRDRDTKEPIRGVMLNVRMFAGSTLSTNDFITSTTDKDGHYQLVGLPKLADGARSNTLEALPGSDVPYFRTGVRCSQVADGFAPVAFDIELKRGVWVAGRLVDQATDRPVVGYVSYYPFIENEAAREYSHFDSGMTSVGHDNWYRTADDGSYRIPAIRGRGIVVARAFASPDYRIAVGAKKIGWKVNPRDRLVYHLYGPELTNAVREINLESEVTVGQDLKLVPLSRQEIRLLDQHGKPLEGVRVGGRRPKSALNETDIFHQAKPGTGSSVEVLGLKTDGKRLLLFSQDARKLGKVIIAEETTTSVNLEPHATFQGRLVDAQGKPIEGLYANAVIPQSVSPQPNDKRGWGTSTFYLAGAATDANGRFHFDHILPGVKYEIRVNNQTLAKHKVVEPGEVTDFGELRLPSDDEQPAAGQ